MSGSTTELSLALAVGGDDNADYLVTSLANSLRTMDALFNNVSGHNHGAAHQGGTIANIPASALADGIITSAKIADGAIQTQDLADSAVTSIKIADGTIATGDLADGSVTSIKIADGTIASGDLADGSVITQKIADNNVTTAKIGDGQVTSAKIADGTIQTADLAGSLTLTSPTTNNETANSPTLNNPTLAGTVAGNPTYNGTVTFSGTTSFTTYTNFNNDVSLGQGAMATGSTSGFPMISIMAGPPTGTPNTHGGGWAPMVVDNSSRRLYIWAGGGWHYAALT